MKWPTLSIARHQLDLVAGLSDGILTALTLAAGHMLPGRPPMSLSLAVRIGLAGAISGAFIFMVAHYAELRGALVQAERELNISSHGHFAATRLGRSALVESAIGALIASTCSFCGALLPLTVGVYTPGIRWLSIAVALLALAILGYLLAVTVYGSRLRWVITLVLGGAILAWVGMQLEIA